LSGKGVSWCATCDGFFFRNQEIVVVGGGDTAMEEAIFLTKFAHVTVVHRRDSLRASKIMQDRAFANEKISFIWDSEVIDVLGENKVEAVRLRNLKTGAEADLAVTGLFIAIGHDPRSELFDGQLDKDDEGYLTVTAPTTHTKIPGVFACGDVVDHIYRQAITAAASGCSATACPRVRPVTASSSATSTSWWSAVATRRWRRRPSSPASPRP
jgi:thioredoxin reductase (NADPH)